jgi:hypothetical protein
VRHFGTDDVARQASDNGGVWEFTHVPVRMTLSIAGVVVVLLGGTALYAHQAAAPACDSNQALGKVYGVLRDQFHLETVFLRDSRTTSGGFFSATRDCVAEVAEIRGNINAADMPWRLIHYRIAFPDRSDVFAVTVDLGGAVPFAPPTQRTLLTRLLAFF